MSDEPEYRIQWKGNVSGPYTRAEVAELLARGQISLLHAIEVDGQWKGVGEFLGHTSRMPRPVLADPAPLPTLAPAWEPENENASAAGFSHEPELIQTPSPEADAPGIAPPAGISAAPAANASSPATQGSAPDNTDFIIQAGYILCGLCFLLPLLATIPALTAAFWLHTQEKEKQAKQLFILCPALTVLGVIFWLVAKKLF
jgi:hypothetical protein